MPTILKMGGCDTKHNSRLGNKIIILTQSSVVKSNRRQIVDGHHVECAIVIEEAFNVLLDVTAFRESSA